MKKINNEIIDNELNNWCELTLNMTKQMMENPTRANKWIFDKLTHDEWMLNVFPRHLASVAAYKEFFNLTGLDIRDYDWFSSVKNKNNEKFMVHKLFADEHLTTAYDFKNTLKNYYNKGILSVDLLKELICMQRLCWITKEEDKKLNNNGFKQHRQNPLQAYSSCGIEIYDKENENLKNIMSPDFGDGLVYHCASNKDIRIEFFNKLKDYFDKNSFNGEKFVLKTTKNVGHAIIYHKNGLMINVRVKDGVLNDICAYIDGDKAKEVFDTLILDKSVIEKEIGYNLVWDRNNAKKAVRIGRFGVFSTNANQYGLSDDDENLLDEVVKPYEFDLDVEKVAQELVNFHKVFVSKINNIQEKN